MMMITTTRSLLFCTTTGVTLFWGPRKWQHTLEGDTVSNFGKFNSTLHTYIHTCKYHLMKRQGRPS